MLESCSGLVRPGGLLCIITCSIEVEENESVVGQFLERARDFEPMPLENRLPKSLRCGLGTQGRWRVLPTEHHDGFTVHVLRRLSHD
jgi:16S rRNA (cytosine967-C5)-methyltransferase